MTLEVVINTGEEDITLQQVYCPHHDDANNKNVQVCPGGGP